MPPGASHIPCPVVCTPLRPSKSRLAQRPSSTETKGTFGRRLPRSLGCPWILLDWLRTTVTCAYDLRTSQRLVLFQELLRAPQTRERTAILVNIVLVLTCTREAATVSTDGIAEPSQGDDDGTAPCETLLHSSVHSMEGPTSFPGSTHLMRTVCGGQRLERRRVSLKRRRDALQLVYVYNDCMSFHGRSTLVPLCYRVRVHFDLSRK